MNSRKLLLHFIITYSYAGLFLALSLGVLGVPIPDEALMAFVGYLIAQGKMSFLPAVLVSAAGSLIGMTVSYLLGRGIGLTLIKKYGAKIKITEEKLQKLECILERFGYPAITFGYFFPGVRHVTAYSAGIGKMPYRIFLFFAIPGALLWTVTFISLGHWLGKDWHLVLGLLRKYEREATIIFALLLLTGIIIYIRRHNCKKL